MQAVLGGVGTWPEPRLQIFAAYDFATIVDQRDEYGHAPWSQMFGGLTFTES
jgi:hypothetical protein